MSRATWLLFTGVPAPSVALLVRCPWPLGSCSPVCRLRLLFCLCRVVGHLAPVHRCACSVCCFVCGVSLAIWLLFTCVPARCVVLHVWCLGSLGSSSLVCPRCLFCCVCGVLGNFAPVQRCACSVCCVAWAVSLATRLLFIGVPAQCVVLLVRCPGPLGSCSPVCPLRSLLCSCSVLGHWAPVHRCACSVFCFACAVLWATCLLFTGVPAWFVVLCLPCPRQLGSCSLMCPLGVLCCVCGVLGHLAPVHRCARSVCCFACAVSWATGLLFTGVPAPSLVLLVRCCGPLGSCSAVCLLGVLCCVCGVLGHSAPLHRCVRVVCCVASAVSWATWLPFTRAPARCVVLRRQCPGPLGSCSPVCPLGVLCCVCGVPGHLAPVHRCPRSVRCFARAVSWATGLLFTGVPAPSFVLLVRCCGALGSCSLVCPLRPLLCLCSVMGHWAPVHRCARSVFCFPCAVLWATWLLLTSVPARCVVLRVWCLGSLGSSSPVCPRGLLCCVCGVLGHLASVNRCACSVCCVASAVSWATRPLFTGVPGWSVVLRVRCPGPLGSCSAVCPLRLLFCLCGVVGHLAPVHRCARVVCCVVCAVSWATWLLFTGAPAQCVVLRVRCPGPLGSCLPVCPLRPLLCLCSVLGHWAPVHRCARSVFCFACAVLWATWLLFTGVPARCAALCVRCPGPVGSCSRVCPLGLLCCVCGVLGHSAPLHRCARSVLCFACAVFWATWLLFTGVPAWFVVLRLRCPGQLGSCSPVRLLAVLCCVGGVLGHLAPVHQCARSVCCVACAVSWATSLLFTGVPAPFVALLVQCPGPLGSCSPVCPLRLLFCLCGVVRHLAPVHRCACSVSCFVCAVSWATWLLSTSLPGLGVPSLCCPRCMCVCGVLAHWAPVHRCARCVRCACAVGGCVPLPPPLIFFSVFVFLRCSASSFGFLFGKKGACVHCRHRHGQLAQRCNSVVFPGVCSRCFGGSRAPGVRLARPDVHGYGSGQVWLVASLLLLFSLVRRLCGLWVWAVATLLGDKG